MEDCFNEKDIQWKIADIKNNKHKTAFSWFIFKYLPDWWQEGVKKQNDAYYRKVAINELKKLKQECNNINKK